MHLRAPLLALVALTGCGSKADATPTKSAGGTLWEGAGLVYMDAKSGEGLFVLQDAESRHVVALEAVTGKTRWTWAGKDIFRFDVARGTVVVSQRSGALTALELATGRPRWTSALGCALARPAVDGDLLVAHCTDLDAKPLRGAGVAVNLKDGTKAWEIALPDSVSEQPALDADAATFGVMQDSGSLLVSVERATGRERWRVVASGVQAYALRAFGDVLVGGGGMGLVGFAKRDGAQLWKHEDHTRTSFIQESEVSVVHGGVVALRNDGLDALDPRTGKVKESWTFPKNPGARLGELQVEGDRVFVHFALQGGTGEVIVLAGKTPEVLATPAANLAAVSGGVVLVGALDQTSTLVRAWAMPGAGVAIPEKPAKADPPPVEPRPKCANPEPTIEGKKLTRLADDLDAGGHAETDQELFFHGGRFIHVLALATGKMTTEPAPPEMKRTFGADAKAYYWAQCGASGCGYHGDNQAIASTARGQTQPKVLAEGLGMVTSIVSDGKTVYFGQWGDDYGRSGGVGSVPADGGGAKRVLWTGGAVDRVAVHGDTVYALAKDQLVAIDKKSGKVTVLLSEHLDGGDLRVVGDEVFVAGRGDPYWASKDSGGLWRVPHAGAPVKLLGPIRWPEHVAVDAANAYVLLDDSSLLAVPRAGGEAKTLVAKEPEEGCNKGTWLWSHDGAVYWIRGIRVPSGTKERRIWQLWRIEDASAAK